MLSIKDFKPYQIEGQRIIANQKTCALFMKPGMGKTATTLYGLRELKPKRTLIVAPKKVCETVWPYECDNWAELKAERYSFALLMGSPAKRLNALATDSDFHLINYELLDWLTKQVKLSKHYDAIVFDELSMLKNSSSKRFKSIRRQLDRIPVRIGLTGTPTGNSLLGLWSQVYACVGSSNPLGKTYTGYKAKYFYQGGFGGREWVPYTAKTVKRFPGRNSLDEILSDLQTDPSGKRVYSFELDKEYCPIQYHQIPVSFSASVKKQYQKLAKEFELVMDSGIEITAPNAATLKNKLRQFESGAIYQDEWVGNYRPFVDIHSAKLEALDCLIEELSGDPLIIVYEFKHELERLQKRHAVVTNITPEVMARWDEGDIPWLAIHPASAGHGLNLQKGGCNIAFMTIPWSLELWQQVIGRVYRTGQKRSVNIYTFSGFDVERQVYNSLIELRKIEASTFKTLKAGSLAA